MMKKKLPFSRIFWPTKCTNSKEGYIIGWNIRSFIGCVACVIPSYEIEFEELEMALKLMKEDPYLQDIHQYCSGPPIILGVWQPNESIVLRSKILKEGNIFLEEDNFQSQVDILSQKNHTENLWITMTLKSNEESIIVTPSLKSQSLPSHQFNSSVQSNVAVTTVQPIYVESNSTQNIDKSSDINTIVNNIVKKQINDKDLQKTTSKTRHPTYKNKLEEKVILSKENTSDNSKLKQRFSKKVSRKSKKALKNNREKLPFLKELFCFGYQYPTQTQIIFYSLSSPYHYYSTHPICLDFNSQLDDEIGLTELERIMRQGNCSLLIESRLQELLKDKELLNYHYTKENSIERHHQSEIPSTVIHRNLNEEKKKEISSKEENSINNFQNSTQNNYINTNYKTKSKENSFYQNNNQKFQNIMFYVLLIINFFINMEKTLKIYLFKIFQTIFFTKLYENSSTFKQIETKFAIALRISNSWHELHKKWKNHPLTLSRSVHFYDSFYLIICDSLLGIIIGILLFSYSGEFLLFISLLKEKFTQVFIISQIEWLMGWPAGFKLNDNLDSFMGQLFLFYNEIWIKFLDFFPFSGHTFVLFVSISGLLGLSTMISILSDFIHISTLHVSWFYTASARIYMYQLHAISSLWKLFRGKKFNVLRNRIDSCDYDIDQLLLGTILFTVIFFLFPTVAIYYLYFSLVRFVIAFIQFVIFCALQILNHFPIYGLVLYLYDWSLFTGGIYFEILYSREQDNFQCTYLNLKKSPGSIASIFHYYSKLSGNFFKNNSILGIIFCVLSGSPIKLN